MRLAIVHDYLIQMGGAERVVAAMADDYHAKHLGTLTKQPAPKGRET
jgi:hypothetical protein